MKPKISIGFNIVLFIFLCFTIAMDYLFKPEIKEPVPWDIIYNRSPMLAIIGAVVLGIILILGGAKLLQNFWNRFISDILKIRDITFHEALAIILIAGILYRI